MLHLTFRSARGLGCWGADRVVSLPPLDNRELVIFVKGYLSILWAEARAHPSYLPLVGRIYWNTPLRTHHGSLVNIGGISFLLLKTTVYNQPSSLWTELKKQNFTKFYFSSFIYLNSGVFFFLNCVCFEGSSAGLQSSPLTCKRVCSRLTWAEWRKKLIIKTFVVKKQSVYPIKYIYNERIFFLRNGNIQLI